MRDKKVEYGCFSPWMANPRHVCHGGVLSMTRRLIEKKYIFLIIGRNPNVNHQNKLKRSLYINLIIAWNYLSKNVTSATLHWIHSKSIQTLFIPQIIRFVRTNFFFFSLDFGRGKIIHPALMQELSIKVMHAPKYEDI